MLRHTHCEMYLNQHENVIILHVTDVKVTQNLFVNLLSSVCVYLFNYQHVMHTLFIKPMNKVNMRIIARARI
jgi:hypothetical protein